MTKQKTSPNVVFLVLDTHRRDRLGMYGYQRGTSPNLDAFAGQATVFDYALSPAQWTIPSHASMFTGEAPSTHLTTQSHDQLDSAFRTSAEWLRQAGYQTSGFCNNPLVGVLDNNLKRGFNTFYNYGGAIPTTPVEEARKLIRPLSQIWERYTQLLRRISYPVQNAVARSDRVFQLVLNPVLVPLWSRFANFKGDAARSLRHATEHVRKNFNQPGGQPQYLFVNVMETHLPFTPPDSYIQRFAPYFREDRRARDFMRVYNSQALRWLMPMEEPFSELEYNTLSDLYDAEVAYQDGLLAGLLGALSEPEIADNTLVIITADHGEMLGEHAFMGHGLGVYEELVHVPLIVRRPGQTVGERCAQAVSTTSIYHTILDAARGRLADLTVPEGKTHPVDQADRSLSRKESRPPVGGIAVSEAIAPAHMMNVIQKMHPRLIDKFACWPTRRAALDQSKLKLIQVEGAESTLYDIAADAQEANPLDQPADLERLETGLRLFLEAAVARQPQHWTRKGTVIEDEALLQRLRSLGYLE